MAPPGKVATLEDLEFFNTAYDSLRAAREQLQAVNLDIFRWLGIKCLQTKSDEESNAASQLLTQHSRAAFGKQDPWDLDRGAAQWFARNRAIIESSEFVNQELDRAHASKAALESIHSALRGFINRLSRPYLRSLTIIDLPDEILLEIFAHLDFMHFWRRPYVHWCPSADIKALRLVCRRLSNIASHLLVRVIHLNLHEESSLKRMEEISRHPAISKGVHVISVNLNFYNASFIELEHFLLYYAEETENTINVYEQARLWELDRVSKEVAAQLIAEGKELVAALHRLSSGEQFEEDEHHALRVSITHQMYLELLQRQDSLLQGGDLYRAMGSAMARMPCARSLVFDDSPTRFWGPKPRPMMVSGADMWESIRSRMLVPLSGYEVKTNHLEPPSYRCIIRLIDAVRDAGASLHHLDIKLSFLDRSMDLVPSPDSRPLFSSGMQQLRSFTLKHEHFGRNIDEDDGVDGEDNDKHVDGLLGLLSACLDTSSLQALDLNMRGGREHDHFPLRLKDIFNRNMSLDKLTDVSLSNLDFNHIDLIAFLRRLPTRMESFSLHSVGLHAGSWCEVLDALREKKPAVVLFRDPDGTECEDMTEEEYNRLFQAGTWGYRTEVEAYISGIMSDNPLRMLQDGTPGVGDDGIMDVEE